MSSTSTFIISLGGSLIVPATGVDWKFLRKFKSLILAQVKRGRKFYLITGGGATCRNYQKAATKISPLSQVDLDLLGIHVTKLHAQFLRILFGNQAHSEIINNPTLRIKTNKKIILGAGWKPGCSTDLDAVLIARANKVKTIINLSNVDHVYDKDPKRYKDAKKIERIDWQGFRRIIGNRWFPGLNLPFDPIASKQAQQIGLKIVILNGKRLGNLKKFLQGKKFKGTVIKD